MFKSMSVVIMSKPSNSFKPLLSSVVLDLVPYIAHQQIRAKTTITTLLLIGWINHKHFTQLDACGIDPRIMGQLSITREH
jgi:hypothetical protein